MMSKMIQLSLIASIALFLLVIITPGDTTQSYAAVLANITSTPTEPAPPTETPVPPTETPAVPTVVPPTSVPPTALPTATPTDPIIPTPEATPTSARPIADVTATPWCDDDDDDGDSSATPELPTPTPLPTATPTITPSVNVVADPSITKRINQNEANPGDEVAYTIDVINRGNGAAENVIVTDTLPDELIIIDMSASRGEVTMRGQSVSIVIGLMEPGEQVTVRISARIKADTQSSTISNSANITTTSLGDDPSNNTASVPLTLIETAVLPAALPQTGSTAGVVGVAVALLGLLSLLAGIVTRRYIRL